MPPCIVLSVVTVYSSLINMIMVDSQMSEENRKYKDTFSPIKCHLEISLNLHQPSIRQFAYLKNAHSLSSHAQIINDVCGTR